MRTEPPVRDLPPGERRAAARLLAQAFADDPVMQFLFPGPGDRTRRLAGFYRLVIRLLAEHGRVQTDATLRGVAVWQAPAPPRMGRWRRAHTTLSLLATLRTATPRAGALNDVVMSAHPREDHWYLALLGTGPAYQGQGVGSALLADTLGRCDRLQLPAYLESSKESNIPFYERHGFRVTCELSVPEGPRVWPMLREPRPPPASPHPAG
jgi:GNAT superfamily N-acetyltransferase